MLNKTFRFLSLSVSNPNPSSTKKYGFNRQGLFFRGNNVGNPVRFISTINNALNSIREDLSSLNQRPALRPVKRFMVICLQLIPNTVLHLLLALQ